MLKDKDTTRSITPQLHWISQHGRTMTKCADAGHLNVLRTALRTIADNPHRSSSSSLSLSSPSVSSPSSISSASCLSSASSPSSASSVRGTQSPLHVQPVQYFGQSTSRFLSAHRAARFLMHLLLQ